MLQFYLQLPDFLAEGRWSVWLAFLVALVLLFCSEYSLRFAGVVRF